MYDLNVKLEMPKSGYNDLFYFTTTMRSNILHCCNGSNGSGGGNKRT